MAGQSGDPAPASDAVSRAVVAFLVGERSREGLARTLTPAPREPEGRLRRLSLATTRSGRGRSKGVMDRTRREFEASVHCIVLYGLSLAYPPLLVPASAIGATIAVRSSLMSIRAYRKSRKFSIYTSFVFTSAGLIVFGWWETLCILSVVISGSRYLLLKTEDQSNQNLVAHFRNMPTHAWIRVNGTEMQVPLARVRVGDVVVVRAGETVPVDGRVLEGDGEIDEASLTGESLPVRKREGDRVLASTMMLEGRLAVRVEQSGEDTTAAQVISALRKTADYKLTIQTRGEAHANAWSYPMFLVGLAAAPIVGPAGMVATWVSIPGLNYRIVAPYAMLRTLSEAQEAHILVKDGRVLEALQEIDTVVFDKTGTLTEDSLAVVDACFGSAVPEGEIWDLVAAAEHRQSHPVARALSAAARARGAKERAPDSAEMVVGAGVRARVGHRLVAIGNAEMMARIGVPVPPEEDIAVPSGATVVHVAVDRAHAGHLVVEARLRPESADVVAALNARGIHTAIISGDAETVTRDVATHLGVAEHYASVLPHEKAELIRAMQERGRRVLFVGDGVNDAVALRQANVSISLRGATTVAVDTAHIVLLAPDLRLVTGVLGMVDAYDRRMRNSKSIVLVPAFIAWGAIVLAGTGPLFTLLVSQGFLWSAIVYIARTKVIDPPALEGPSPTLSLTASAASVGAPAAAPGRLRRSQPLAALRSRSGRRRRAA